MKIENSIYLAIASYMDTELIDTVFSALSKAKNPNNIFISICSQDDDDKHPNLEGIFSTFNVLGYDYIKMHHNDSTGVGLARSKTQISLSDKYEYYIQVDSHTQFAENWDSILIDEYKSHEEFWGGKIILTAYPIGYEYTEYGNITMPNSLGSSVVRIKYCKNQDLVYEPKYRDWDGDETYGDYHGYFCAGFAFGRSEYFIEVPYDPEIYFNGEEQTMSIRFYCKDIKLIAPKKIYIFHHYKGDRRNRNWEKTEKWQEYDRLGKERLAQFFMVNDLGVYGITDLTKYAEWIGKFVTQIPEDL